jgi:hypothetical protein
VIGFGSGTRTTTDASSSNAGQSPGETNATQTNARDDARANQKARPNNPSRKPEGTNGKKPAPPGVGNALRLR